MGFWEGETCEYCAGMIMERVVTLHRKVNDDYILIEDVPAGVCEKCGMRYFSADVLKAIEDENIVRSNHSANPALLPPAQPGFPSAA